MTIDNDPWVELSDLSDQQIEILREEAEDWLVSKSKDLGRLDDASDPQMQKEVEEAAALGRIVSAVRYRNPMHMPDPVARELVVRTLGETRHLDELKHEYDKELGEHEAWAALLSHFDPSADAGDSADDDRPGPEESQGDEPKVRSPKWIELAGKLSEDQLAILRKEVTMYLAGRTGDLHLLATSPDPEREIAEIAAVGRLAFWLCRGEIEAPDAIAEEMIVRLAEASREINDYEELRERYEDGKSEEDALAAFATLLAEANRSPEAPSDA